MFFAVRVFLLRCVAFRCCVFRYFAFVVIQDLAKIVPKPWQGRFFGGGRYLKDFHKCTPELDPFLTEKSLPDFQSFAELVKVEKIKGAT